MYFKDLKVNIDHSLCFTSIKLDFKVKMIIRKFLNYFGY